MTICVKKKITVVITNRADYGRLLPIMRAIRTKPNITLQVIIAAPNFFNNFLWPLRHGKLFPALHFLWWHLSIIVLSYLDAGNEVDSNYLARMLSKEGFPVDARIPMIHKGGSAEAMISGAGVVLTTIPREFKRLGSDILLIYGDRFELLPVAMVAAMLNIPIAHIEGGDISGTIDESVRHAVTKLAHIHFPITEKSRERLIKMGEHPKRIYVCGMPALDMLGETNYSLDDFYIQNSIFPGSQINLHEPFALIIYHPVTTRGEENRTDVEILIRALTRIPLQKIVIGSNRDAGSSDTLDPLWHFALTQENRSVFFKSLEVSDFYRLLKNASVAVGNSSSFLREAAYLGTPVVLVGDRQQGRERGTNVVEVLHDADIIVEATQKQFEHGRYESDPRFGDGTAGTRIADVLASLDISQLPIQKKFYE